MTREEAISEWTFRRNHIKKWLDEYGEEPSIRHYVELIDMAIAALSAEAVPPSLADVYKWERDVALSQLEEYGIGFAEKKRDDLVEVVRCKDCKWAEKAILDEYCVKCTMHHTSCMKHGYCHHGERREP